MMKIQHELDMRNAYKVLVRNFTETSWKKLGVILL